MSSPNIRPLLYDTYLAVIKNSVGSKIFKNLYAEVFKKKQDVLRNGVLSCAFFVSAILTLCGLIKKTHSTVSSTVKDLEESGWKKVHKLRPGSILVWEPLTWPDGEVYHHIGFYLGKNQAVSNSYKKHCPIIHHFTFGTKNNKPLRKIISIYCYPKLTIHAPNT